MADDNNLPKMAEASVHAGFPSPAQDYMSGGIDLNKELVRHPDATFFVRVSGDSMVGAGVDDGDILVVDRSLEPYNHALAICCLDREFLLRRLSFGDNSSAIGSTPKSSLRSGTKAQNSSRRSGITGQKSEPTLHQGMNGHQTITLMAENTRYKPITVTPADDFTVWGIVTYIIKSVTP